jgi:hypothetical protein
MKKGLMIAVLSFVAGGAFAAKVHDWKDLDKAHNHLNQVIEEMERVSKANHYDMGGHAYKAIKLSHDAEAELRMAIDDARAAK